MPTILNSLFHKVQYHKQSYRGRGWGVVGSHEVAGPSDSKKFIWPNGINSGCFQLHRSQNVATSMPSLTSKSCGDSLPAVCLVEKVGAIYRPPEHPWMPDRPVNEATVKVDCWTFGNGISINC